jgi:adenosine deaminase
MKFDKQLLRRLPKVLLHEHLDGVLRPQTIIELAKDTQYAGLPTDDPGALSHWFFRGANQGSLSQNIWKVLHTRLQ